MNYILHIFCGSVCVNSISICWQNERYSNPARGTYKTLSFGVAPSIYRDTNNSSTDIVAISILLYWISESIIQNHKLVTLSMTHWFDSYLIFWSYMYKITQKFNEPGTVFWCFQTYVSTGIPVLNGILTTQLNSKLRGGGLRKLIRAQVCYWWFHRAYHIMNINVHIM